MKDIVSVLVRLMFFVGICIGAGGIFQTEKQGFPGMLKTGVFMVLFGTLGLLFIKMYFV